MNPRTLPAASAGSCAVLHDRDRDGDLDMTGIDELNDLIFIFDNTATTVDVEDGQFSPRDFQLHQSYPNPFIGSQAARNALQITLPFSLNRPAKIRLELFNLRGQKIALLSETDFSPGNHSVGFSPKNLSAGIYIYRLSVESFVLTKKIILLP